MQFARVKAFGIGALLNVHWQIPVIATAGSLWGLHWETIILIRQLAN